jgi:uncharacterized UBP type Zn finger protein
MPPAGGETRKGLMRIPIRSVMHRNIKSSDLLVDEDDLCAELAQTSEDPSGDPPAVSDQACEDCIAEGVNHWAHLRKCLTCGHVACCDSSPRKHATAHFKSTGHPVMRSAEPGETWRWCYRHAQMG